MSVSDEHELDAFWAGHFAERIAAGQAVDRILSSVELLNLQRAEHDVDLTLCERMPNLRDVILPRTGVRVTGIDALSRIPRLRGLVVTGGSLTPSDLPALVRGGTLSKLHLNEMTLAAVDLDALRDAPKLSELTLHRVQGLTGSDLATLVGLTRLRLSECEASDLGALASMPRLRTLEIEGTPLATLDMLAAPKLVAFVTDVRAADTAGLAHLTRKTGLQTFEYPVSDVTPLANCTHLARLRLDGSAPVDLRPIAHLPISSIDVYFAPSEQAAEAILQQARDTWPGLVETGYRKDWAMPQSTAPVGEPTPADPPTPATPRPGLLGRLFGKGKEVQ